MDELHKDWTDNVRSDGVRIDQAPEGNWVITSADGKVRNKCPCCDKWILSKTASKLVADFLFPLEVENR